MNRPTLIRKIYAELRFEVGGAGSEAELLKVATAIAEIALADDRRMRPKLTYHTGGVPFNCWSLDRAMADGGWKVMKHEHAMGRYASEDDFDTPESLDAIKKWMMENTA